MTDEQKNTPSGTEQREENVDLYALFFKYFAYWPWFVASVLVCIISAFIYLRYQAPVYNVDAAVLIKEGDKKGGSSNNPMGALQDLGMFSMTNNFDNEVEILKSRTLIKKVVNHLNLYMVLRNKWTPLQIVITNGYTCSIFQVAKITRKTEITTNNTESLTHLLFIILKLNIINRKFCKYCIYFISSIV